MSHAYLAAPVPVTPPPPKPPEPTLTVALESSDGSRRILLDGRSGFTHMPGSTGLEMPPFDIATMAIPGVPGSSLLDARVEERRIFLPLFIGTGGGTQQEHLSRMDNLRSLVDPLTGMFRIVAASPRGEREIMVVYTGGLEGNDSEDMNGLIWNKVGLTAVACDPFAQARSPRLVEFQMSDNGSPFLGVVGGTDAPWPGALSSSVVIGDNMQIVVASEVPVYPTLELVGPMDSFDGTMTPDAELPFAEGAAWSVSIPNGIPAGATLRLVTDPRARSVRLDGQLAAGMVARGSTLRPFLPGLNTLDVAAPGGTDETRVRLSWRERFRSLW